MKFIKGDIYYLKNKSKDGSKTTVYRYVCKGIIHSILEQEVNIVIMKSVDKPMGNIYTLNKSDCIRYHIKYETGLQILSSKLNWIKAVESVPPKTKCVEKVPEKKAEKQMEPPREDTVTHVHRKNLVIKPYLYPLYPCKGMCLVPSIYDEDDDGFNLNNYSYKTYKTFV